MEARTRRAAVTARPLRELHRAARAVVLGLLLCCLLPVFFGWTTTVVLTGSMAPALRPGDVVIAAPVPAARIGALAPGAVVLVHDPAHIVTDQRRTGGVGREPERRFGPGFLQCQPVHADRNP